MTIPEACRLVLEAAAMGNGYDIFVFDMGEPVRIYDLAKNMITLAGLELDKDIKIEVTGLRPGEKLYEELLKDEENTLPTCHEKIFIAKVRDCDYNEIKGTIDDLIVAAREKVDKNETVMIMKMLVPEYVSNNSEFEKMDKNES